MKFKVYYHYVHFKYNNTFMGSSSPYDAIKGTEPRYEDERQRDIIIERRK